MGCLLDVAMSGASSVGGPTACLEASTTWARSTTVVSFEVGPLATMRSLVTIEELAELTRGGPGARSLETSPPKPAKAVSTAKIGVPAAESMGTFGDSETSRGVSKPDRPPTCRRVEFPSSSSTGLPFDVGGDQANKSSSCRDGLLLPFATSEGSTSASTTIGQTVLSSSSGAAVGRLAAALLLFFAFLTFRGGSAAINRPRFSLGFSRSSVLFSVCGGTPRPGAGPGHVCGPGSGGVGTEARGALFFLVAFCFL